MNKKYIAIIILVLVIGIAGTAFMGVKYTKTKEDRDSLTVQLATAQAQIDSIGPMGTAYTVRGKVREGDAITEDKITTIAVPQSSITNNYITDASQLANSYFRINMDKGTPLTTHAIMVEPNNRTLYSEELVLDRIPADIQEGDYIDIRLTLPRGEPFIVLEHKRVMKLIDNIVQVTLTEEEFAIYRSARVDKAIYGDKGLSLFASKYVEPGLHDDTEPFYPVRVEIAGVIAVNPNINDPDRCINNVVRADIDMRLSQITDEEGSKLASGVSADNSNSNKAYDYYNDAYAEETSSTAIDETGDVVLGIDGDTTEDPFIDESGVTDVMDSVTEGENLITDEIA